jgi:hypothetical protein
MVYDNKSVEAIMGGRFIPEDKKPRTPLIRVDEARGTIIGISITRTEVKETIKTSRCLKLCVRQMGRYDDGIFSVVDIIIEEGTGTIIQVDTD